MRVLALDTSTQVGTVSILDQDALIAEYTLNLRSTHSERLMPMIDRLLVDTGFALAGLDGLAVAVGPGSFTGLRIGISTAKGLALAADLPIAPIPTLDALASTLPLAAFPVCPILDAKKGEVYTSLYERRGDELERCWEYLAISFEELVDRVRTDVIFVGDAVQPFRHLLSERLGEQAHFAPLARQLPTAAAVAELGMKLLAAGNGVAPDGVVPLYIRSSEAELRRRRASVPH
ncbi:MAG TPA: tRNA (adenosine(37)-N6)-threonylcarbamoyltransferase complex dimerization subunit type 1 TsaB [Methylomirabilota bacterium]|nr:tRNA (adenosine(37)-N6)-threonylcarbamoyltransferase complex dimerization subunit type 1 TsaB [Methylomirabilota bacterium]